PNYRGPAASVANPVHHLVFELYALDTMLEVPAVGASPAQTRAAVMTAMAGHVRGKGVLTGVFKGAQELLTLAGSRLSDRGNSGVRSALLDARGAPPPLAQALLIQRLFPIHGQSSTASVPGHVQPTPESRAPPTSHHER